MSVNSQQTVNVAIIGGSGFWSETNHHKHLLELKSTVPVWLAAIVDIVDPKSVKAHPNLHKILELDQPEWVNPTAGNCDIIISDLKNRLHIDLIIVACNPSSHYDYALSAIEAGVNVICDKPIVSELNAATDPQAANNIIHKFRRLESAYRAAKTNHPSLIFHSILRRRSLKAFMYVADELSKVYRVTGAGVNNLTCIVNGGVYKLPAELTAGGAHGYLDGIGSISHSAYHYLDAIAWFISEAPGRAVTIRPHLNYVVRVKDYLQTEGYESLAAELGVNPEALQAPNLPQSVLGCELSSGYTFALHDNRDRLVGQLSFNFNHLSFSPRILRYDKDVWEPANRKGGGRMSQFFLDVNQDGLQNWQISKNDVVFEDYTIKLQGRRHPLLSGPSEEAIVYEKAYNPEITLKHLLGHVLQNILDAKPINDHYAIREIPEERLSTELYAACYQLLAHDFIGDKHYEPQPIGIKQSSDLPKMPKPATII